MKPRGKQATVSRMAMLLRRSRLLDAGAVEALQQRWSQEPGDAEDPPAFARWLVASGYLSDFQLGLLLNNKADFLFLGPFKLVERISKGSQATVFKAIHSSLGHPVALKVLAASRARDSKMRARFQHMGELARQLDHLHVVQTLAHGEDRGLPYLAMEYLEGETLGHRLEQRGRLSPEVSAEIIRQAFLGLAHLHERGIVHRNLEPGNLMLQRSVDEQGPRLTVKIIDFSLARTPGAEPMEDSALPAAEYRAPEMVREAATVDIRCDIYSLGRVLLHALTGRPPVADPVASDLPERLEPIIARMLAREPAGRYPTPAAAAAALEGFLHPETLIGKEEDNTSLAVSVELVATPLTVPAIEVPAIPAFEQPSVEPVDLPAPMPDEAIEEAIGDDASQMLGPVEGHPRQRDDGFRLTRRDAWMLLLGGIGLLIAQVLGWFLAMRLGG